MTVRLTSSGFQVVSGDEHDSAKMDSAGEGEVFESPYSLLSSVSPGFVAAFGGKLQRRLEEELRSTQEEDHPQ